MKKTMIALAVAASAVISGSAMAALGSFDAGNTNNTVKFGGTITPSESSNNWVWAVGQGYDNFSNTTKELTESGTKLTIVADQNIPLLVGKLTSALLGQDGISPEITFSDSKGNISPVWTGQNAMGTLDLTVNDAQQQEIGVMTLNISSVAPLALASKNGSDSNITVKDLQGTTSASAFEGAVGQFSYIPKIAEIDNILVNYGAPTISELQAQIKAVSGLENIAEYPNDYASRVNWKFNNAEKVFSGAYALGIPNGANMSVKFNNAVVSETQWNASLQMQVSYN
ncbi:TPA: hypothetical protein JS309_004231 [Escherichia coli]|nr:hypothetical protein [Escherichia coli]